MVGIKMNSVLARLLMIMGMMLMVTVRTSEAFWVCPSGSTVPTIESVHYTATSPSADCVEVIERSGSLAFFVHLEQSILLSQQQQQQQQQTHSAPIAELVQIYPLPFFPNYVVVMVAKESALLVLDTMMGGNEKQLISGPKRTLKHKTVIPKFQKVAHKDDIVNSMDEDDYYLEMEKITGERPFNLGGRDITITTRYTHTQGNKDVAAYYLQRLKALGLDAFYQEFRYSGQTTQNIIGIKRGTDLADEVVVVGAHMDSTSPSPQSSAPGCIDNGSGAEGVLLMAKAFSNSTSRRTIHFILWGAEEQGLIGSNYYVDNLDSTGYDIAYSLIMDMIGYSNKYFGVKVETSSSSANKALGDLYVSNLETYASDLTVLRSTNYFGSDHVPFIDSGIPCFLAIEQDDVDYVGYHRTTDRVNYLSVEQSLGILRGLAGTLYDLAY